MTPRSPFRLLALAVLVPALFLTACTDNFTSVNTNPVEPTAVSEDPLFTRSQRKAMLSYVVWQRAEHLYANMFAQHFANPIPSFPTDRYEVQNAWLTAYWDAAYSGFGKDIQQVINQTRGNTQKQDKLAQARIWQVFVMHRLTDFFGDVPYSQAFKGNPTPAYDQQESIYRDLFAKLDTSVSELGGADQVSFGQNDLIYQGNAQRWKKFANSLRLRMAMRVSEVDGDLARQQAQAAVNGSGGLISSNDEAATMTPTGDNFSDGNPLALIMLFQHNRASKTLTKKMKAVDDPRLKVYVDTALASDFAGRRGYPNGLTPTQINQTDPDSASLAGPQFQDNTNPISVMSHAEVKFLQAEAAVRGYISDDAGTLYRQGIEATMQRYGIASDSVNIYLSQPSVAWNSGDSQDEKIRKIILQKWLALFGRSGFEAWAEYRRTGYPDLQTIRAPDGGNTNGVVPRRVPYPQSEDQVNTENHEAAVGRLDEGDTYLSRMWWDVN